LGEDPEPKYVLVVAPSAPAMDTNLLYLDCGIMVYLILVGDKRVGSLNLDYITFGLWLIVASFESMLGKLAKS